ncbi:MAG: hypothetical protein K2N70_01905 [Helicobacter sp.]|nr:hypothetical protein [Helicobacter sp.]
MPCICYPFVASRQTLLNNPPNPCTLFNCMCSARTMLCPTALRLCYALRLEHRRCALWLGRSHDGQ